MEKRPWKDQRAIDRHDSQHAAAGCTKPQTFAADLADGQSSLRVKQSVKLEEWLLRLRMLSGYMLSIGPL